MQFHVANEELELLANPINLYKFSSCNNQPLDAARAKQVHSTTDTYAAYIELNAAIEKFASRAQLINKRVNYIKPQKLIIIIHRGVVFVRVCACVFMFSLVLFRAYSVCVVGPNVLCGDGFHTK